MTSAPAPVEPWQPAPSQEIATVLSCLGQLQRLLVEHGEAHVACCFAALLTSRIIHQVRTCGGLRREHMTRKQAIAIVQAVNANTPMP